MKKLLFGLVLVSQALFGAADDALEMKIKKGIVDLLPIDQQSKVNVRSHLEEGVHTLSGDRIFFLRDSGSEENPLIMVAKAYVTPERDMRFDWEQRGLALLEGMRSDIDADTIKVIAKQKGNDYNLIILSVAKGKTILALIEEFANKKQGERAGEFQKLENAMQEAGAAYARFHHYRQFPIERLEDAQLKKVAQVFASAEKVFEDNKEMLPQLNIQKLMQCIRNSVQALKDNPGNFGFIHGDASPNNVFIDPITKKITFIDVHSIIKYVDPKNDDPQGFAAHEIYQFMSSLEQVKWRNIGVSDDEVENLKKAFMVGYEKALKELNIAGPAPESMKLFKLYWDVRGIDWLISQIKQASTDAKKEQIHGFLNALQVKISSYLDC